MAVHGWDASDYDWGRGPMDVGAAVRDGITFFTHKATEGTTIKHAHYGDALNRARAAGMPLMGAYMVVRTPGNGGHGSIAAQVDYLLAYLDAATPWWRSTPEFFLQVDLERWSYDSVDPTIGKQAAQLLRSKTGKFVILYGSKGQYGDGLAGAGVPLWNANYPTWSSTLGRCPAAPYRQAYTNSGGDSGPGWATYSGQTPTFWQYTDNATIGSQPGCDANAYRGTLAQLRALITGGTMASTRTTNYGVTGLDKYSDGDLIAALILNYDPEGAAGRPGINGVQMTLGSLVKQVQALATVVGQVLTGQGAEKSEVDQLLTAVKAIGAPSDAQIAAMAGAVADKLIASNANGLTAADHAGVVDDVKRALAAAAQAQATALAQAQTA